MLGKKIRECREKLGMTQDELAQLAGYKSRSSINKIEQGGNDLPQTKIAMFAKILKTTPSELMGWNDDKQETLSEDVLILARHLDEIPAEDKQELINNIQNTIELYKKVKGI